MTILNLNKKIRTKYDNSENYSREVAFYGLLLNYKDKIEEDGSLVFEPYFEHESNLINGLQYKFPKLIKYCHCLDLNDCVIPSLEKLVKCVEKSNFFKS